jgi:hypothetical protein
MESASHGSDQGLEPERDPPIPSKKKKARDIAAILARVQELPDCAIIDDGAAAVLLNISKRTLRRNNLVPRVKTGPRTGGRQLGAIRQLGRSTASA